jgi:hypothetical protein
VSGLSTGTTFITQSGRFISAAAKLYQKEEKKKNLCQVSVWDKPDSG